VATDRTSAEFCIAQAPPNSRAPDGGPRQNVRGLYCTRRARRDELTLLQNGERCASKDRPNLPVLAEEVTHLGLGPDERLGIFVVGRDEGCLRPASKADLTRVRPKDLLKKRSAVRIAQRVDFRGASAA
jgi:hypothetical protein